MSYQIEKNIPFKREKKSNSVYPFGEMEVGDSFVCNKKSVSSSSYQYGKKCNKKFAVSGLGNGEFRVWRTE